MEKATNKILKWLLFFLAIFLPCREIIAHYTISYIKFLPDMAIWVLFIFVLIKNKFKLNLKLYDIFYIGFLIFGFVSTLSNGTSIIAYMLQFRSITTMYILFYILRNTKLTYDDIKPTLKVLIAMSTILISLVIVEHLSDKSLAFPVEWAKSIIFETNFARAYSIMNNPNTFAMYIFFIMFLMYILNRYKEFKTPKYLYFITFLGIFLSASRSTMIIVALFFIFLTYLSFKEKKYKDLILMLILLVASFGLSLGLGYIKANVINKEEVKENNNSTNTTPSEQENNSENVEVPPTTTEPETPPVENPNNNADKNPPEKEPEKEEVPPTTTEPTLPEDKEESNNATIDRWSEITSGKTFNDSMADGRIYHIRLGLKIFADYPIFGTGFGTFGSAASKMITPKLYEKYGLYENFYADNEYIKVLVESGIVGTLLFIAFTLALFKSCIKNKFKIFAFISFLLIGMFYNVFELQSICYMLFITLFIFELIAEDKALKKDIN